MNKLVTVCITTYNRDFLIEKAIRRVFEQSYKNIEVIVVDDYSSDNTEDICRKLVSQYNGKLKYIRHEVNKGLATARNSAINNAKGIFFTFIDDDDSWDSHFIEHFVKESSNYDTSWCFCGGVQVIRANKIIKLTPEFEGPLKNIFAQGYTPPVGSQFYFTETLLKYKGYNEDILTGVDHDLWLTLSVNNVNIKGVAQSIALPNDEVTLERMTTNKDKRLSRLTDSLSKWKDTIVPFYGEEFYNNFCKAYLSREKKAFLFKILMRSGFVAGVKYYRENKDIFTIKNLSRDILRYFIFKFGLENLVAKNIVTSIKPTLLIEN